MKKYILATFAIALAIGFSAFTKPTAHVVTGKKFTTADYWYSYGGSQTIITQRKDATKYTTPSLTEPTCVASSPNECAVKATVTLDNNLNPPANPDFTGASFNSTTDMPIGGTGLVIINDTKN